MTDSCCQTYSGLRVLKVDGALVFLKNRLAVDADGAPNSYTVDGNGLSYTCDGAQAIVNGVPSTPDSDPQNWQKNCQTYWAAAKNSNNYSKLRIFGFAKDSHNVPIVQTEGDPLPGKGYISETSVPVPDGPAGTQRHWVDAAKIPYIVMPGSLVGDQGLSGGEIAVVYLPKSKKSAFAVYGDGGKLGEASVKLHQDLGKQPVVRISGIDRAKQEIDNEKVLTIVFPKDKTQPTVDATKWQADIKSAGAATFKKWGGEDRLNACAAKF